MHIYNYSYTIKTLAIIKKSRFEKAALFLFLFLCCSQFINGELNESTPQYRGKEKLFDENQAWRSIKSSYFTIYFAPDLNLNKIENRLERRFFYTERIARPEALNGIEGRIAYRMDLLLKRSKEILDIYPLEFELNVKIFKNRRELSDEYYKITGIKSSPKSFYAHRFRTIYTSEDNITDSVIAHEMGHALVDQYFKVVPSETVGEMLATYVDMHLGD